MGRMEPKYGKDYGIKVKVPWFVKCPLLNRLCDTCLVEILLTTFNSAGEPWMGVADKFRIPILKTSRDVRSLVSMYFALPDSECTIHYGKGLLCTITLLDVNHKEVLSSLEDIPLQTSFYPYPKDQKVSLGHWRELCVDLKFGNKDFYEI